MPTRKTIISFYLHQYTMEVLFSFEAESQLMSHLMRRRLQICFYFQLQS